MAIISSSVTCETSATLLVSGGLGRDDARLVQLRNDSANDIFIGGPTVTATNGIRLPAAGGSLQLTLTFPSDVLFGIVAVTASPLIVLITRA